MSKKPFFIFLIVSPLVALGFLVYYLITFTLLGPAKPVQEILSPELQAIKARGEIIIGTEATYPPMEYFDEHGNFVGIDIEIGKRIAKELGVKAKFRHIPWQELFDKLLAKEVDMVISAVTILPEREKIMAFSKPYFNAGQVIVTTKENAKTIKGVEDLKDKKVGVQAETTSEKEALKISANVVSYPDYVEAKKGLISGEIDVIVIDYPAAIGMTSEDENLTIVGKPFTQEFYGIALRKDSTGLLDKINNILSEMQRSGELDKIVSQWLTK
jgi:polar amino acid transport system substrate-binding protein